MVESGRQGIIMNTEKQDIRKTPVGTMYWGKSKNHQNLKGLQTQVIKNVFLFDRDSLVETSLNLSISFLSGSLFIKQPSATA